MAFNPTIDQKKAIYVPSGVLVSAAAGSGKTAVLVERVINLICGENPIPADKLLIVTFTNAAAAEMRVRIERRIDDECKKQPDNMSLLRSRVQIRNAKICTIDSFCIDLVRENFDRLGLNPDFGVGADSDIISLADEALSQVFDIHFESGDTDFYDLLDAVGTDYDEQKLKQMILDVKEFADYLPFPEKWMEDARQMYENPQKINDILDRICLLIKGKAKKLLNNLLNAVEMLQRYEDFYTKYFDNFEYGRKKLIDLITYAENREYDDLYNALYTFKFPRISSVAGAKEIPDIASALAIRDDVKNSVASLKKILYADRETAINDLEFTAKHIDTLLDLTKEYSGCLLDLKKQKNIFEFSDIERFAFSLLCRMDGGEIVLSNGAQDIIDRYDEVLVDEYQDVNDLQNIFFSVLSDRERKLFSVGDVKQSIYRFRGANPNNFLQKKKKYIPIESAGEHDLKKIILSNNFRSRKGICDFVNYFFNIFMNGEDSSLQYNEEERLNAAAVYPETDTPDTQLYFINPVNCDAVQGEAEQIAKIIKRNIGETAVFDSDKKAMREAQYKDITILLRSMKYADVFANTLKNNGIPVSLSLDSYVDLLEIRTMFSLLSVIENPTRDIELAAVMMSPVFCFTANEMAKIRICNKDGNLISAVTISAQNGNRKAAEFLSKLRFFKTSAITHSISELLQIIYDETGFCDIVSVLSNGGARRLNLIMLQNLADGFEHGEKHSISSFIQHIDKVNKIKPIKSATESSGGNSVRIMSVHSSKGLQFPICIYAGTAKTFNNKDFSQSMMLNEELGISFKPFDEEQRSSSTTLLRELISNTVKNQMLEEELRLAYVAMTRAQDKLIITVCDNKTTEKFLSLAGKSGNFSTIEEYRSLAGEYTSVANLLYIAALAHPSCRQLRKSIDAEVVCLSAKGEISAEIFDVSLTESVGIGDNERDYTVDTDLVNRIKENIKYVYPYEQLKNIESKASVAELAHKAERRDYSFTARPAFVSKSGMTPAARGTATHRFMQFANFENAERDVLSELERLYEYQFITEQEKNAVDVKSVARFFDSDIYKRIKKSDRVEREMRFLTEIPAKELSTAVNKNIENEMVIVQGSVDCAFTENDGIVVLDFKTDRIKRPEDIAEAYGEQLSIYAKACEKIFERPVLQKIIYSFSLSAEIQM